MMSVFEYASDVNKSIDEIFSLCSKLGIKVNNENDLLSDDDIILLDNEIENTDLDNDSDLVDTLDQNNSSEIDDFEDSYEEELEEVKVTTTKKKKKKNNKNENRNSKKNGSSHHFRTIEILAKEFFNQMN